MLLLIFTIVTFRNSMVNLIDNFVNNWKKLHFTMVWNSRFENKNLGLQILYKNRHLPKNGVIGIWYFRQTFSSGKSGTPKFISSFVLESGFSCWVQSIRCFPASTPCHNSRKRYSVRPLISVSKNTDTQNSAYLVYGYG